MKDVRKSKVFITVQGIITGVLLFMAAAFLVLKTYRAFSGSTAEGGVWNVIQLAFVLFGIMCFAIHSKWVVNSGPLRILILLSGYMLLTTVLAVREVTINSVFNLVMTIYAANVFILFYYYGRTSDISKRTVLYYAFFITALIVLYAMLRALRSARAWTQRGAVADVYYVLGLLPLLMIYFTEKRVLIPIITAAVAVSFTGKRAGMIAVVLMMIAYYLITGKQKNNLKQQTKTLLKLFLLIAVVVVGGIYLDNRFKLRIVERLSRIFSDGGSGRDVRWEQILEMIWSSGPVRFLLGHGGGSIMQDLGKHAHNDFLELFYEQGLAGALMLVLFYGSLARTCVRMIRKRYRYAAQFAASLICSLVLSMFSFYIVDPTYVTCGMICMGAMLGDYERSQAEGDYDLIGDLFE